MRQVILLVRQVMGTTSVQSLKLSSVMEILRLNAAATRSATVLRQSLGKSRMYLEKWRLNDASMANMMSQVINVTHLSHLLQKIDLRVCFHSSDARRIVQKITRRH